MAEHFKFNFSFKELGLTVDSIGLLLDYHRGGNTELVSAMISEALTEAARICDLRAEFVIFDDLKIEKDKRGLLVNEVFFNTGKIITGQLRRAESLAVFICTAGPGIGSCTKRLMDEADFLKAYIYDMIGSQAADGAADLMQEKLSVLAGNRGQRITNRYSPGYCGWHLSAQQELFSLIPDNHCGVSLSESSLMQPIKSVSGIIGIGKDVRFNQYTCELCDQQNCIYRNYKSILQR
jgi:hypothetical protein